MSSYAAEVLDWSPVLPRLPVAVTTAA